MGRAKLIIEKDTSNDWKSTLIIPCQLGGISYYVVYICISMHLIWPGGSLDNVWHMLLQHIITTYDYLCCWPMTSLSSTKISSVLAYYGKELKTLRILFCHGFHVTLYSCMFKNIKSGKLSTIA